jgi:DNA repair exonuclease SbcCD nuclease subunit
VVTPYPILFTADWHLKLGQKNVPIEWARKRYQTFFNEIYKLEKEVELHIIGGDLFDRLPTMDELELYFEFVSEVSVRTLIYDGNHEATKKNRTFLTQLKKATKEVNSLVSIIDSIHNEARFGVLPYCELHGKWHTKDFSIRKPLFTHVRGAIPPHVTPEVDLKRFAQIPVVYAGDLHSHLNTQLNIVYPGSPMTTQFHRNLVDTGYIIIDGNVGNSWEWKKFKLPQLIRKTVSNEKEMVPTVYHHTIYELEGNIADLSSVANTDLLDKKIVKRKTEAALILDKDMTIEEELVEYLSYILELENNKVKDILSTFHDYAKEIAVG